MDQNDRGAFQDPLVMSVVGTGRNVRLTLALIDQLPLRQNQVGRFPPQARVVACNFQCQAAI